MSCIVAQQSNGSGAKMLRLLLRTARVSGTPQEAIFFRGGLSRARGKEDTVSPSEPMSPLYSGVKAKHFGAAVCLSNERCRTIF
ncbi:hypothetical protein SAMN04488054_10325 [Salibacterium qingdaonense]|uniref:Uncharacterized protein n=1 Tax=Salibacterium qingdaonense TaxID=266892 RepID=A0A1I4J8W4_9BACI|nr:hypothetical protein SAMN04488054_10325 [Salibacterium qingdaonense]